MRTLIALLLLLFVGSCAAVWWLQFESFPPEAKFLSEGGKLGRGAEFEFSLHADAPGLHTVEIRLQPEAPEAEPIVLHSETFEATSWRGSGLREKQLTITPDFVALGVPEGKASLEVYVDTYAWHLGARPEGPQLTVPIEVDLTPPRLEMLSSEHNLRVGGSAVVVFRQSPDTVESGVAVGDYYFPATRGYFADEDGALAFFAVPQDLDTDARARLVARDGAGNEREVRIPTRIRGGEFRERTLAISDSFLQRKVPEIREDNRMPESDDLLQGYLTINRDLRRANEETIRAATKESADQRYWRGAFQRQPRAASVSNFGDRRAYEYNGEIVDRQVHLGVDLASVKHAPIEAAQAGVVVFADYLGIYGETVILDHGLGIFSLYGHLSSIAVSVGDEVAKGGVVGRSGETGLAGGDHLHFSIMIHGIHVDPVEWWDDHWLEDRILSKLALLPAAASAAPPEAAPPQAAGNDAAAAAQ